jgi:hypothetical protein
LGTLNSLIVAYGDQIGSSAYEVIIVELSTLIRFSTPFDVMLLSEEWLLAVITSENVNSLVFPLSQ